MHGCLFTLVKSHGGRERRGVEDGEEERENEGREMEVSKPHRRRITGMDGEQRAKERKKKKGKGKAQDGWMDEMEMWEKELKH